MFKIIVIAFIVFLIFTNSKNNKAGKKGKNKTNYRANPNTNYSSGATKNETKEKTEDIPKEKVREKKAEFPNANYYTADCADYLNSEKEDLNITDIPNDLDFSLLKLSRVKFEVESTEDQYCKCVRVFQDDTFLGCLKKDSPEENEVWFLQGGDNSVNAYLVYIDEEKRELKLSYGVYYFMTGEDLKAEYTDTVMVTGITGFKECDYLPSRKEALGEVDIGDTVEFEREKNKGRYLVVNHFTDEIGVISESDLGMLLYYMENEKEYFYIPVINKIFSDRAELEIRIYKKKHIMK